MRCLSKNVGFENKSFGPLFAKFCTSVTFYRYKLFMYVKCLFTDEEKQFFSNLLMNYMVSLLMFNLRKRVVFLI